MSAYQFAGSVYDTSDKYHDAIAGEWLSAGGLNGRGEILIALRDWTDARLAAECAESWDFDTEDFSIEELADAFGRIRANPAAAFGWDDE